jgi:hypothetical protein
LPQSKRLDGPSLACFQKGKGSKRRCKGIRRKQSCGNENNSEASWLGTERVAKGNQMYYTADYIGKRVEVCIPASNWYSGEKVQATFLENYSTGNGLQVADVGVEELQNIEDA